MRIRVGSTAEVPTAVEQRLYEAAIGNRGMWLTTQDVQTLISDPHIDARITDAAERAVGAEPATNRTGFVRDYMALGRIWSAFARIVASNLRAALDIIHIVPSHDGDVPSGRSTITITPDVSGVAIHFAGTGLHEVTDGPPVYLEVWCGLPRVYLWDDINDPEPKIFNMEGAFETNRRPDT